MVRALTIRFAVMGIGITPLVIYLNAVEAAFGVALAAVVIYCGLGAAIVGYYLGTHLDEIPARNHRRHTRGA